MKNSEKKFIIAAAAVLLVLGIGLLLATKPAQTPKLETPVAEETASAPAPSPDVTPPQPSTPETQQAEPQSATMTSEAGQQEPAKDAPAAATPPAPQNVAPIAAPAPSAARKSIDVNAALSDRILGNTSSSVQVSEHASLTCSHCGDFHRNTFDEFKKKYIDTGKAFLVFSDFPLNEPAFKAAMVARCLPEDKYFDFIHLLYHEQEKWAFSGDYLDYLKEKSGQYGLSPDLFDACLKSEELKAGMENRMKGVAAQWKINATPTFVINNKTVVSGALPFADFSKILDEEIAKVKGAPSAQAPATEEKPTEEKPKENPPSSGKKKPSAE